MDHVMNAWRDLDHVTAKGHCLRCNRDDIRVEVRESCCHILVDCRHPRGEGVTVMRKKDEGSRMATTNSKLVLEEPDARKSAGSLSSVGQR